MKTKFTLLFIVAISCFLMAFQCDDDNEMSMEDEQKALTINKKTIEDLAATSICNETTQCKFIALGSKPCGGAWGYLTYSTSIDVNKLEGLVEDYNKKEAAFNQKWGVISDCALVNPPARAICENNICVAVY